MKHHLYAILLVSFLGLTLRAQKGILQNFSDPKLFNLSDTSCLNIAGEWPGEETEYTDTQGNVKGKYSIKFMLTQEGNKVSGNTFISFDNGQSYGNMKLRGLVNGNKLYFEEYEVVDQKFSKPGVTWCLRTGELDFKLSGNKATLEGANYKGYAAYYYFDCVARVSMQLEKTLQPEEVEQIQKKQPSREALGMQLYPNPANHEVTVSFNLVEDLQVRVDLFTLSGELISTVANEFYKAGKHQHLVSLSNYSAGVYLIRMQAGKQVATAHLVIAR